MCVCVYTMIHTVHKINRLDFLGEGHHDLEKCFFVSNSKEDFVFCYPIHLNFILILCGRLQDALAGTRAHWSSAEAQSSVRTQHVALRGAGFILEQTVDSLRSRWHELPLSPPTCDSLPPA